MSVLFLIGRTDEICSPPFVLFYFIDGARIKKRKIRDKLFTRGGAGGFAGGGVSLNWISRALPAWTFHDGQLRELRREETVSVFSQQACFFWAEPAGRWQCGGWLREKRKGSAGTSDRMEPQRSQGPKRILAAS